MAEKSSDGDLVELLRKRVGFNDYRADRQWQEDAMLINMAFWSGKQRIWFTEGRQFQSDYGYGSDDSGYQINLIESRVANAVARVLAVQAEFRAKPESGSMEDREIAATTDRVFDHLRSVTGWERTRRLGTLYKAICGDVYYKVRWDALAGDPTRFYKLDGRSKAVVPEMTLSPELQAQLEADGKFEDVPNGDVAVEMVSPFAAFPDPSARDGGIKACRYFSTRQMVDIAAVAENWDVDEKDIQPENGGQGARLYDEAIAFMTAGNAAMSPLMSWMVPPDKLGRRCMYVESWERPSRRFKRGRRIVYAGGKILNRDRKGGLDNPFAADRSGWAHLPFVKDPWSPHPGRFWGKSLVESLISPQFNLNLTRGQLVRFMLTFGLPNTYVGDQAGIDTDTMSAGGGRIYKMNEASVKNVSHGPVPQMPPDIARFGDVCLGDLNAAASQTEIEASSLPGQLRSGAAIRSMNEDRYMPLTIPASASVQTVQEVGQVMLAVTKLYYGPDRVMRYLGEDNEWVVEKFNAANLVTDLQIVAEPSVTNTLASERADLLDALQMGAFNPQLSEEDRLLIYSGLHYKTSDEFIRRKLAPKKKQERELQAMMQDWTKFVPNGYPVLESDDHVIEARAVQAFMWTPEFEALDPNVQALITLHWKTHEAYIAQAVEQQLALQAQIAGTPGQKGQASQPAV